VFEVTCVRNDGVTRAAQRDKPGKLAMPGMSLIYNYRFSPPGGMTREERRNILTMRRIWRLRASDFHAQRDNQVKLAKTSSPSSRSQ
jgi:hypothetical protein